MPKKTLELDQTVSVDIAENPDTTVENSNKEQSEKSMIDLGPIKPFVRPSNLFQKMIEIKKHVKYLQKETEGFNYKYTSSSQVLSSVRDKMNELGIMLVPGISGQKIENYKTVNNGKEKNMFFTSLDMYYIWINAENPEDQLRVMWAGQGTDDFEKGIGKALTYAEKYIILKTFNIPTDKDDPDAFQQKEDRKEEKANPKPQVVNLNSSLDRKAIIAMIMEMHEKDKNLASDYLESATGKRNIKDVTDSELEKAMVKIRADHHKFVVAQL